MQMTPAATMMMASTIIIIITTLSVTMDGNMGGNENQQ